MGDTIKFWIAKLWDKFKQSNPVVAMVIYLACNSIVVLSVVAPDYGVGLPKWASIVVLVATTLYNGINGSRTTQILNQPQG